jgi:hypothetical protein
VADLSRKHSKPLIVVVGKNELSEDKTRALGCEQGSYPVGRQNHESEAFQDTYALIKKTHWRMKLFHFFFSPSRLNFAASYS